MIKVTNKGNFKKTYDFLKKMSKKEMYDCLEPYAKEGCRLLAEQTPVATGKTAASWTYDIKKKENSITITWSNTNTTEEGIPIVVLLIYGHATGYGTYVEGNDFVTPTIEPLFKEIADKVWKEVVKA